MAPQTGAGHIPGMDRDETRIADLRAILAGKRRLLADYHDGRINLPPGEALRIGREIHRHEQSLRDAGVSDV